MTNRPSKTEAIQRCLDARTHADLADLYHFGMETQVIVDVDGGVRVEDDFRGRQWHG